jgi:LmbE family N-acetylglucosaminyl deacetylase
MAQRRFEDAGAMALLQAEPRWLDLLESEYIGGTQQNRANIVKALQLMLEELKPATVVFPLGIHHTDHIALSDACTALAPKTQLPWFVYLDMPYAQTFPDEFAARLIAFGSAGFPLGKPREIQATSNAKMHAVQCYTSQIDAVRIGLPGFEQSMLATEQYWDLPL